jgi:predicted nucleic acid-binding protein
MTMRYVFDTGAMIAVERGKQRATRFLQLVRLGRARIIVPLPVVAEWWRGRTDAREEILSSTEVVGSLAAAKAAGIALGSVFKTVADHG